MPKFFLHIANDHGLIIDEDGREFETADAAVIEASRAAGAILADELRKTKADVSLKIYVEDAGKRPIATVAVSGLLTLEGQD